MSISRVDSDRDRSDRMLQAEAPIAAPWTSLVPRAASRVSGQSDMVVRPGRKASKTTTNVALEKARETKQAFAAKFKELAADKGKFDALLRTVYGKSFDASVAEDLRERAARGDFSWLPPIRWVDAAAMRGAAGAYDAKNNVVLLSSALLSNPRLAVQTYTEEVGHFLDKRLRRTDAAGDEGELFRWLLAGEKLSRSQIAAIRAQSDHGVLLVGGKRVAVEFSAPLAVTGVLGGIAEGIRNRSVFGVVKGIIGGVMGGWRGVASAAVGGVTGFGDLLHKTGTWMGEHWGGFGRAVGGFIGKIGEGIAEVGRGIARALGDVWDGIKDFFRSGSSTEKAREDLKKADDESHNEAEKAEESEPPQRGPRAR